MKREVLAQMSLNLHLKGSVELAGTEFALERPNTDAIRRGESTDRWGPGDLCPNLTLIISDFSISSLAAYHNLIAADWETQDLAIAHPRAHSYSCSHS